MNPFPRSSDSPTDLLFDDRRGRATSTFQRVRHRYPWKVTSYDFVSNPDLGLPPVPDVIVVDIPQSAESSPGTTDKKKPSNANGYSVAPPQVRHSYFLELYDDPKSPAPIAVASVPYVSSVEMTQPSSLARSWVLSGEVYEEHSGFKQRTFRVRGRSGFSTADLAKFYHLRNFLERYATESAANKNAFYRAKDIRLKLNFQWEGEAFWASLLSFSYAREVGSTRISYSYEMTLVTNGSADLRWDEKSSLSSLSSASVSASGSRGVGISPDGEGGDPTGQGAISEMLPGKAAKAHEELVNSPPAVAEACKPPASFQKLSNIMRYPRSTILSSPSTCQRIFSLCVDIEANLNVSLDAVTGPAKVRARQFVATLRAWVTGVRMEMEQALGSQLLRVPSLADIRIGVNVNVSAVLNAELSPKPVPAVADRGRPVAVATVKDENTTLIDLAGRLLGDRNRWVLLAELNNMQDARTFIDGRPLQPGDKIIVPAPEGVLNADPESTYGTNLRIVDGDLVSVGDVDVALISGLENYYQCFSHRMRTVRGANRTYPDFGLPPIVGTVPDTPDAPAQLLSAVRRQTLSDHRVASVSELTLKENLDKYEISLAITTAIDEKTTAAFTYEV